MRREIQVTIEDYLSEMLLKENFNIGTTVKVDANRGQFKFSFIEKKKSSTKKA
jgi:ATP-dependent Clp protease ATP-binding subunit ClpA